MAAGRALKTELVTSTDDFERGFERAKDEVRDFAAEVERRGREARDSMRRNVDDIGDDTGDRMRETGTEVGEEFLSNLGESFSSGDYTAMAQDVAGGLLGAAKTPMLAAAAGFAVVGAQIFRMIQEGAQKALEQAGGLLDITDEVTGQLDALAAIRQGIEGVGGGDFLTGLEQVKTWSDATGLSVRQITDALGGDVEAIDRVADAFETLRIKSALNRLTPAEKEAAPSWRDLANAVEEVRTARKRAADAAETQRKAERRARREAEQAESANKRAARAARFRAREQERLNRALLMTPEENMQLAQDLYAGYTAPARQPRGHRRRKGR